MDTIKYKGFEVANALEKKCSGEMSEEVLKIIDWFKELLKLVSERVNINFKESEKHTTIEKLADKSFEKLSKNLNRLRKSDNLENTAYDCAMYLVFEIINKNQKYSNDKIISGISMGDTEMINYFLKNKFKGCVASINIKYYNFYKQNLPYKWENGEFLGELMSVGYLHFSKNNWKIFDKLVIIKSFDGWVYTCLKNLTLGLIEKEDSKLEDKTLKIELFEGDYDEYNEEIIDNEELENDIPEGIETEDSFTDDIETGDDIPEDDVTVNNGTDDNETEPETTYTDKFEFYITFTQQCIKLMDSDIHRELQSKELELVIWQEREMKENAEVSIHGEAMRREFCDEWNEKGYEIIYRTGYENHRSRARKEINNIRDIIYAIHHESIIIAKLSQKEKEIINWIELDILNGEVFIDEDFNMKFYKIKQELNKITKW